jgi:DNA-binding XRE family transcriptional regulator
MIDAMPTLGEYMTARREQLALSQNRAAKLFKGSRTTWVSWESDASRPERYNYVRIEAVLRWAPGSVAAILDGGEPTPIDQERDHSPPPLPPPPGWGIDPAEWARYDPIDREMILAAIRIARKRSAAGRAAGA